MSRLTTVRQAPKRGLYLSLTPHHATPRALFDQLNAEFQFNFDPCPLGDTSIWDGRLASWQGMRVFCNPPYGRTVGTWLAKAREAEVAVYLLPSRTDTAWWHDYALAADEIRFIRGRLQFGDGSKGRGAPFPSVILVYRRAKWAPR